MWLSFGDGGHDQLAILVQIGAIKIDGIFELGCAMRSSSSVGTRICGKRVDNSMGDTDDPPSSCTDLQPLWGRR